MAVWRVAIEQAITGSERPIVNVFHVEDTVTDGPGIGGGLFADAVSQRVWDAWKAAWQTWLSSSLTVRSVNVSTLDGVQFHSRGVNAACTVQSDSVPPNAAVLVRKSVPGLPRRRYGRMFVSGVSESQVNSGGVLTPTAATELQRQAELFRTGLATAEVRMVQLSWTGSTPGAPDSYVVLDVTALSVAPKLASMKRRLRK